MDFAAGIRMEAIVHNPIVHNYIIRPNVYLIMIDVHGMEQIAIHFLIALI